MTDSTGGLPPAGWYPDPYGAPFERWWDGAGWTEHTTTPAAAEPVAEPAPYQPVAYEPVAYEPAPYQPAAYEPAAYEPVAYEPPPLEEPPAATANPFSGFASPAEPDPYEAPAYEAPAYEAPTYEAPTYAAPVYAPPFYAPPVYEPAPYQPPAQAYEPAPTAQIFGSDLIPQPDAAASNQFAQPTPAAQTTNPGGVNAPSSFDFGFGDIVAGGPAPSNASVPAPASVTSQPGEDGLFGSWQPNEYSEPLRNRAASAGLTLGVLSFFLSALAGIPGLILSVLGLGRSSKFARQGDGPVGRGKAIAGLALSVVGSALSAALILYGLQLFNAAQNPTDAAAEAGAAQGQISEYGLEVGDMGTITLADSDAAAIQFTVTAIIPNFTCTAPDSVSPANGQFVAVQMAFTLSPEYLGRMTDGVPLRMSQSDWLGFAGEEGASQVDSTDAGNSCIAAAEQLPTEFAAGENISGTIVLDMAVGTTAISYAPTGVSGLDPGMTRWEWNLPA